jgi:fibronectin-binding autotransporter adhesin
LIYTGIGETSNRVLAIGNAFTAILDQSGTTGNLKFSSNLTGGTGSKTLLLQGSTAGTGEISGAIGNGTSGTQAVTKAGTGTWTLSGPNTYTGGTVINGGVLALGSAAALGSSGTIRFGAAGVAGTLQFSAANTTDYSSRFSSAAAQAFRIDTNGQSVLLNSQIDSVGGTLTKFGAGTLTLGSSSSDYDGATTVEAGTLLVSGSISGSAVTVNSSGTLGGGTTASPGATGAVTVNSNGTLAPGMSIGTLNTGALSLNSASTFALEIETSTNRTDLVAVTGSLSLADADDVVLTISDLAPGTYDGTPLVFITYTAGSWDGDLFTYGGNVILDDQPLTVGENEFTLDYNYNNNSVALLAVPEPGSLFSLLGGCGLLAGLQRFRRRR